MTIDKAIEILTLLSKGRYEGWIFNARSAEKLGVEALRQVKESRFDPSTWEPKLLLGETKE